MAWRRAKVFRLSDTERAVLRLARLGKSYLEISTILGIKGIGHHMQNAAEKERLQILDMRKNDTFTSLSVARGYKRMEGDAMNDDYGTPDDPTPDPDCPIRDGREECEARNAYSDWHECAHCRRAICDDHIEVVREEYYCCDHAQEARDWVAAHPEEQVA
jgi:hypothetical protein